MRVDPVLAAGLAAATIGLRRRDGDTRAARRPGRLGRLERTRAPRSASHRARSPCLDANRFSTRSSTRPIASWSCHRRGVCSMHTIPTLASGRPSAPSDRTISRGPRPPARFIDRRQLRGALGCHRRRWTRAAPERALGGHGQRHEVPGKRGTPVQQAELSAIAVSSDGKWLLAAAGAEGVGVQDLERRRWLSRDEIVDADSPSVGDAGGVVARLLLRRGARRRVGAVVDALPQAARLPAREGT